MHFPDLYTGTPLQPASSVQRGVSPKISAHFPNSCIQKGREKELLLTTHLLKRISHLFTLLKQDEARRRGKTNNLPPNEEFQFKVI